MSWKTKAAEPFYIKGVQDKGKINACSRLDSEPENKILNKNIIGTVGKIWIVSVDSMMILHH